MNSLKSTFDHVKHAERNSHSLSIAERKDKLTHLRVALINATPDLIKALSQDYGHRSSEDTLIADIIPCISNIDYTLEHLEAWAAPSVRSPGALMAQTSEVEVVYQPKGVVGIVTPWNFPILLSIEPLIAAVSAGNRAMIKLSEFTPTLNLVLRNLLATVFSNDEVAVIEGEANTGAEFSALPFDHLFFTGSPRVGKLVMKSAAENLTPVTLELGGKSPVIVDSKVSMKMAVERIICGKSLNSGQVCVAPDYVLLPEGKEQEFITEYQAQFAELYPEGVRSQKWTSIVNTQQFERLSSLIQSEITQGKVVIPAHVKAVNEEEHRMVTHLIINPDLTSTLMQEEIFGPILPIITYREIDDALTFISSKEKPLALYLVSEDKVLQEHIKTTMYSGGMCINDAIFHIAVDDAPFGGIGGSGMGHYHGREGFLTFSHTKTVLKTAKVHSMKSLFMADSHELKSVTQSLLDIKL